MALPLSPLPFRPSNPQGNTTLPAIRFSATNEEDDEFKKQLAIYVADAKKARQKLEIKRTEARTFHAFGEALRDAFAATPLLMAAEALVAWGMEKSPNVGKVMLFMFTQLLVFGTLFFVKDLWSLNRKIAQLSAYIKENEPKASLPEKTNDKA